MLISTSADSGVLIATNIGRQDDNVLSMESMDVDIKIDNQHAYVKAKQIFASHVQTVLEGQYIFDLPPKATLADFAVWDGLTRIPGVILERRRAEQVYEQIKTPQTIDPGLITQDDEKGGSTAFNVKVTPIPGHGTKRLEIDYTEMLTVDGLTVSLTFPFKPSGNQRQTVGRLSIKLRIVSDLPIGTPELLSKAYPLIFTKTDTHEVEANFEASNVELTEDLLIRYPIDISSTSVSFTTYRAPEKVTVYDLRDPANTNINPDGYFQSSLIFNQSGRTAADRLSNDNRGFSEKPKDIVVLLDNSLSMHGEKIVKAFDAIDFFLHRLSDKDRFNLILFNESPKPFADSLQPANKEKIEEALRFVKDASIGGGTSVLEALKVAVAQIEKGAKKSNATRAIILITDGNPTLGQISLNQIVTDFNKLNQKQNAPLTQLYAFGIGGDVRQELLAELVNRCKGYFVQYRETEDLSARLGLFFEKIGKMNFTDISFSSDDPDNLYQVYPDPVSKTFDGSSFNLVGRYRKAKESEKIKIEGLFENRKISFESLVSLPEFDSSHDQIPRLWAKARVDALLREINLKGEREDLISEIIKLSQKYKFVTPYTAFIAAPRALLRPRLIQPGDPVIRVKADKSVRSILAVLPFGLTLPLRYLPSEDVWQARFLAPKNTPDGTYYCRLIITDKKGDGFQEQKSFVIDSHAPRLNVVTDKKQVRAGEELKISVDADADTESLTARFYGAQPVKLHWSGQEKRSVGKIYIPQQLPAGRYTLIISAEDFAHNNSTVEVEIEVIG